ncbi:hypothetical protein BGZ73_000830 [Actinomortierella ambigua]|nr:hypothetical protein BGZ73_000830 [Actinomortierella ambigua]
MSILQGRFRSASAYMAANKTLKLSTNDKLALYADYKLATEGLCTAPRPSLLEFEKSAKWKAWREAGDTLSKQIEQDQQSSPAVHSDGDSETQGLDLQTRAMISYIDRVERGNYGWKFDASASLEDALLNTPFESTGDKDLDELNDYLGVDKDEVSAEELLARPYVPIKSEMDQPTTASGISTMVQEDEEPLEEGDEMGKAILLIKNGDVNGLSEALKSNTRLTSARDSTGLTLLHWACDQGQLDIVKLLMEEHDVDWNAQDEEGSTPLHLACLSERSLIVAYLKEHGVDTTIVDNSGSTAEEYL